MLLLLFTLHYTNLGDGPLIERGEVPGGSRFSATLAVLIG